MAKPKNIKLDPTRLLVLAKLRDQKRAVVRDLNSRNLELQEQKRDAAQQMRNYEHRINMNGPGRASEIASPREADKQERHRQSVRQTEIAYLISENQRELELAGAQFGAASHLFEACLAFAKASDLKVPFTLRGEVHA